MRVVYIEVREKSTMRRINSRKITKIVVVVFRVFVVVITIKLTVAL